MYYPRFTKVIIHRFLTKDKTISKRNKIGMHTSRDDYLINTLRFISAKEESQIYGARLTKSMTSREMRETKAYKTYLGYAIGVTPLKKERKFKKPTSPKLSTIPASLDEPTRKSKRVKRPAKKSSDAPTACVVIKETPAKSLYKKREKMTVEKHKGIDLLSKVSLTEEAQYDKVRKKSLREFYKARPSGSGTVTKLALSAAKIKPSVTNEGTGAKPGFPMHETDENESGSESDQEENKEEVEDDEEEKDEEFVKTPSNSIDDEDETNDESKKTEVLVTSSSHSSYLASKFLKFSDIPYTNAKIVSLIDVLVHHESSNSTIELQHWIAKLKKNDPLNTQVTALVDEHLDSRLGATRDEFMSYLSATITARITKQVKNQLPQILPKEVSNFAPSILINKMDESQSYLTAPKYKECYDGLIKSYDLDKSLLSTYDKVYSLKRSRKDKDKDEDPSARSGQGLKKRKTSKVAKPTGEEPEFKVADSDMPQDQEENSGNDDEEPKGKVASTLDWFTKPKQPQEPTDPDWNKGKTPQQGHTQSWLMTLAFSADKPSNTFDELMSSPIDFSAYIMNGMKITNLTQETLLGTTFKLLKGTRSNYAELEYDFEGCYKALSEKLDWKNPKGGDYPFDLTKPLLLVMNGNRQIVPVDYFFNNDLKYLQGGISNMSYTTSITKIKAAQYDLQGIEDMVPNIWSPVKVAYDKYALWGISHWRQQRKTFYGYARGLESSHDVYSTKHILAVTRVEVMKKHGYGYLRKIENRLTNLLGNDVSNFAIALRMFTRSMVIQKRVEDLQLGVESYQKKINVTKPETTRPDLRNKDPYTPYQDPQGFIYVDNKGRNRLMHSDEL
ncbi:hypothetical protein Tco_1360775 [Tanacetum coccineum]